ncbi:MAG: polyphosphate:AMP phosphotransferase [Oscillospiraceae bacterium]|nr:polyphosphate:AMP phosphotransferase [Oscillospiraceae bacterium]
MLKNNGAGQKLTHKEYRSAVKDLEKQLAELQRKIIETELPVLIVFEGWSASGKGACISRILYPLDPRYFSVYTLSKIPEDVAMRPFLWNYWIKTPSKGRISIFDKSWHRLILPEQQEIRRLSHDEKKNFYYDTESFESQLTEDGTLIIKFFLHVSKSEQKKRFDALTSDSDTKWRVNKNDMLQNKNYDDSLKHFENMLKKSNFKFSGWNIINSDDINYAAAEIYKIIIDRIKTAISKKTAGTPIKEAPAVLKNNTAQPRLGSVDLNAGITKSEYETQLRHYQKKLAHTGYKLYVKRRPVIIVYEGWDSAGKGGNIRRLTQELDPRGYEVTPIAAPTREELSHHYLWRFWRAVPKNGHTAIFDRSWYGRVLVERVEGFCTEEQWRRAYKEINDMEAHLYNHGAVIFKFWLHIDKDEQLSRFRSREADPSKQYKMTDEDWRNREKWDEYEKAVNDMLEFTSTEYAPWTVVESCDKRYARIKTLKIVSDTLEEKLK